MNKKIKETIKYSLRCPQVIAPWLRKVNQLYEMNDTELRAYKERAFLQIFHQAYTQSAFYHDLYSRNAIQLDDIKSIDDIKKLPVITKKMIREHPESLLTIPKWKTVTNHTSGTTGSPLVVYESWPALWMEQAYVVSYRRRCGFFTGRDVIASLRGHLDRKEKMMYVVISKTLYLSSFQLNPSNIREYYQALCNYKPKAIEAYPSSLLNLCLLLKENGLRCNIPVIFTSSESLGDVQRSIIENILHGKVFDHYGTTERTISLNENFDHTGYYEDPGYSINEYRENSVVTTSLINSAFPLIRYEMEDKIMFKDGMITGIAGRATSFITGKDGTKFNSAALTYVAKIIPNILVVQLVQREIGNLEVNILPDTNFNTTDIKKVIMGIQERIGKDNVNVHVNIIKKTDLIYTPKSNKLELVVNLTGNKM